MYPHLIEIGLQKYLNNYFFNKEWLLEKHLENLDKFIASKDEKQRDILKGKFSKINEHVSLNDHFHEIMVAYIFHPKGIFQEDGFLGGSPDIIDNGILIEIKTINPSPKELERIKILPLIPLETHYLRTQNMKRDLEKNLNSG